MINAYSTNDATQAPVETAVLQCSIARVREMWPWTQSLVPAANRGLFGDDVRIGDDCPHRLMSTHTRQSTSLATGADVEVQFHRMLGAIYRSHLLRGHVYACLDGEELA